MNARQKVNGVVLCGMLLVLCEPRTTTSGGRPRSSHSGLDAALRLVAPGPNTTHSATRLGNFKESLII